MGYGLSLWVVPKYYKQIKETYKMKHIPHITLQTNLTEPSMSVDLGKHVDVTFNRGMVKFPKMHDPNPLMGSGFYCNVKGISEIPDFRQHMTVWYNYDGCHYEFREPPPHQPGKVVRADTTSDDPSEWHITSHHPGPL